MNILGALLILTTLTLVKAKSASSNPCEGRDLEFVNDYSSCSKYFSCMKDVAYPKTCPEGRWFHHDPLGCHLPNAVQCKKCPDSGVIRIGSPESCTMYTLCIEGIEIDSECPPGTRFDRSEGRCNLEELVNCDYDSCPINERGLQADPSNCRNYIVCFDGSEISRGECNENLLFDSVLNSCALPENVDCENRPIPNMFLPTAPIINPSSKLSAFIGDVPTVPTAGPRT